MTELNTPPPIPDEDTEDAFHTSSSKTTLISMLLMIALLVLSSAMLLHYAMDSSNSGAIKSSLANLAQLLEGTRELSSKTQVVDQPARSENNPSTTTASKSSTSVVKKLFPGGDQGSVRWPKLKLSGFGLPSKGEVGFAIINKKHVIEGGAIDGVTLVEIRDHGVLVEYKGERKTLIIEMTH